jgi:hypothetical protein
MRENLISSIQPHQTVGVSLVFSFVERKALIFRDLPLADERSLLDTTRYFTPSVDSIIALMVASTIFPACMLTRILSPTAYGRGAGLGFFGTAGLYDRMWFLVALAHRLDLR